MRVQTEEWRRFIPGVRMYNGKKTLFYNGEKLWEGDAFDGQPLVYSEDERKLWEVIIVLPGVEIITERAFVSCDNLEKVIMSDTVRRIEEDTFLQCKSLHFVKLSTNLEFIGKFAFCVCESLTSIFVPPSCREIGDYAFSGCTQLLILAIPQNVQLEECAFIDTPLLDACPVETDEDEWIKSVNNGEAYALHRAFSSFNPLSEIIHALVKRQGIKAMQMKNPVGITPSQYLETNVFADISEKDIINRFTLEMMGEV